MAVERLLINNFRNIQNADIKPSNTLNFIFGENGSGKTSVLESLSTLSLGRSFRTRKFKHLVQYQHPEFTLFCNLCLPHSKHTIGSTRNIKGSSLFKLDSKPVSSAAELVKLLPLQVINSESFNLLAGPSSDRRSFLDWQVFHVKQSFQSDWRNYMRCLKQRNILLKSDRIDDSLLQTWSFELSQYCDKIDRSRNESINDFIGIFNKVSSKLGFIHSNELTIDYKRGWASEYTSYYDCLLATVTTDKKLGYTSCGAHRSDIKIKFNNYPVTELFSRGQLKSLITALYIAQIELFTSHNSGDCLLLVDDLPAELDTENLSRVALWLSNLSNVQIFITGVDLLDLIRLWPQTQLEQSKLFHVKHGKITEQTIYTE